MSETMTVRHIAELAKISLSSEEEVRLAADMAQILAFARQLQQLDVDDVPPTQHMLEQVNVMRADEAGSCLPLESILAAAPSCEDGYIAVPKTVE